MSSHNSGIHGPVQCARDLPCYVFLQFKQPVNVEYAFPRPSRSLRVCVEQFKRQVRLSLRQLDCTMDNKSNSDASRNIGNRNFNGQAQGRRHWEYINILEIPEKRDQCVCESQTNSTIFCVLSK